MYLSTYTLQSVYQWNRPCKKRYNGDIAAKLGYLTHISRPYIKLNYTYAMDRAAKNGHLEVIKWLHHNCTECCTESAMNNAAENGHLNIMKWLHENRTEGYTHWAIQ